MNGHAGKTLTPAEQVLLDEQFQHSYARRMASATLHPDAIDALTAWQEAGRTQSLLSMYPHEQLLELPQLRVIAHFFVLVDGMHADESPRKEPHLRRHVTALNTDTGRTLVVGDNVDDVHAARACGLPSVLYHPGAAALVSDARARDLAVPMVRELPAAVRWALTHDYVINPS